MLPWQRFKVLIFLKKILLSILTSEMELTGIGLLPYHFLPKVHRKLLRYSLLKLNAYDETLKFQKYDIIIYDISADFKILFGMWSSLVMSYHCAKFYHVMTITNGINCICFVYFWTTDRGLSIMTSLSITSLIFMQIHKKT